MKDFSLDIDLEAGYVLPINKPYGWTSYDVIRKIKGGLKGSGYKKLKIGHAGTLDPLATGVLLVCLGKATKQAETLQAEAKEYVATIELGATTPSYDLEHEIDERFPYEHITKEMVEQTLQGFIGEQEQIPPIFSAKNIDGKRAYEYAREGKEVVMRKAVISIYNLSLENIELPQITVRMGCSKGTYVRSFARDIGERLSSGGHLTALCRTKSGNYTIEDCYDPSEIEKILRPE